MATEFELKYGASPEAFDALVRTYGAGGQLLHMATTYYDTPAMDFAARKCTLRTRLENGRQVCTLKTPGTGFARGEWEVEAKTLEEGLQDLRKTDAPRELLGLTTLPLQVVCGAEFNRLAIPVPLEGGLVELALDRGQVTAPDRSAPIREVEVELKEGPVQLALGFAALLQKTYELSEEPKSKFQRALALTKGASHG